MKRTQLRGLSVLALSAILGLGTQASAFVPVDDSDAFEIRLPEFQVRGYSNESIEASKDRTSQLLNRSLGGNWTVRSWNSYADSPHSVYGSGAVVAAPFATSLDVEDAARQFLSTNANALNIDVANLRLNKVVGGMNKSAAHFQQTFGGIDVYSGRVHAVFMDTGRVFSMGSDFYTIEDLDTTPKLSQAQAEAIATADVPFDPTMNEIREGTQLLILPVPVSQDAVDFRLVWQLRVETTTPLGVWVTHVDAHTGEIVWRYNDVHFFTGTTSGDVQEATYCNGATDEFIGHNQITVDGDQVISDAGGNWTHPGSGSAAFTATLDGPYCGVDNMQGSNASFNGTVTDGANDIEWNNTNSRADERDTFDGVSDIHDWFEILDGGFGYSNQFMDANVNRSQTCNAYWDGSINFYNAGGGCANTGEIQGVVHHEFGHGVQNFIIGGQGGEGLGEGNSDVLANFITDESVIGRGFYSGNCSSGIRNSANSRQYPEDLSGQVHNDGEIMAGVVWSVRQNLEASLGAAAGEFRCAQLWHFGRLLETPTNQPDQVWSMFVADDDDGDLDNGTPNYDAICDGAMDHDTNGNGYSCPEIISGVIVSHVKPWTPISSGDQELLATITTTETGGNIVTSSVKVHVSINDAPEVEIDMTATGNPDEFSATLEGLTVPTDAKYYITAADNLGNSGSSPRTAPVDVHILDVPSEFDDMESDTGWTVDAEGSDDASTGVWERIDPIATEAQPGDDRTEAPGVLAWITGQQPGGGTLGSNDVDDGSTSLYSPTFNLAGTTGFAKAKYFRWYSNGEGNAPFADDWVVQVRNNGGPWQDVERNMDDQKEWVEQEADLLALFGTDIGNVQLKFIASDLSDGSIVEAGVDDFMILAGGETVDVPGDAANTPRFALYGARPNPVVETATVSFQVPVSSEVELSVFDVAGRRVAEIANGEFDAGVHQISWDGNDEAGRSVGSGVYYVRMQTSEFSSTRSIVLSK